MITRSQKNKFSYVSLDFPSKRQKNNYNSDNNSFINNLDIESSIDESEFESEVINTENCYDTVSETENESEFESNTYSVTDISEKSDIESNSETLSNDSFIVHDNKEDKINEAIEKEYEILEHNLYSVLDGSFFEGYNIEYSLNYLKKKVSLQQIQELNNKLFDLKNQYDNENLNIVQMLDKNYSIDKQKKIIEKIYNIMNSDILTTDYNTNIEELNKLINEKDSEEMLELEKQIVNNINNYNNSYKTQILQSKMSFNNKVIAYKFLKIMESYNNNSSEELIKYKTWLNTLLNIPFGNYQEQNISIDSNPKEINDYIFNIRNILDKNLSFLEKPKDQIINIITHMIRNPKTSINGIGIYGPKGTGKSSLIDSIGKALNRPVIRISLGGSNDANVLNGHDFTYIGSRQGKIIDAIINSKIMNPIIHFDECFPYDQLIETDMGAKKIGLLYNNFKLNKKNPKIKSYNEKLKKFEYKDITYAWEKENNKLIKLKFQNLTTKCTENHLFLTERGYVKAKDLIIEKDKIIAQPSRGSAKILNNDQYQILLGSFLGDGHIYTLKSGYKGLMVRHGIKQEQYCIWKANMFNVKCKYLDKNGYAQNPCLSFDTKILHIPNEIPNIKSNCPQWIIDDLDWKGIAIWFMDDGSICQKSGYNSGRFSTESFDEDTHKRLVSKLKNMGIDCSYTKYIKGFCILLTSDGYKNLLININKYVHSSMEYKINPIDLQKRKEVINEYWSCSEIPNPIVNNIYNVWSCTSHKIVEYKYKFCIKCNDYTFCLLNKSKKYHQCYHKKIRNDNLYTIKKEQKYTWNNSFLEYEYMILKQKEYLPLQNTKVYDIEIKDNHNFIILSSKNKNSSGIVVHNCDKISNNHHGQEIFNTLLHLTDSTTNNQYNCDNYFAGIEFDLSRILFIFTYNDPNNIDPIFADRIYKINITNYSYSEKFSIIQNHLINNILKSFNFKKDEISFTDESIKYLIEKSKNSDGMRTIKNNIQIIISRINTLLLINKNQANVIQLNYKKLYNNYRKLPVLILKHHIDLLLEDSIYEESTELKYPHMYL